MGTKGGDFQELLKNQAQLTLEIAVIAPVLEEFMFRFVPASLFGKNWNVGIISSVAFSAAHSFTGNGFDFSLVPVPQLFEGIFFWYVMREGGLDHSILAHAANNNAMAVAMFFSSVFQGS